MKFFNFGEITLKAKDAFRRFPITLLWAILGTLFVLYIIEFQLEFEEYNREIITLILGISWLIGTRFLVEQLNKKGWVFGITILLLLVFYFHLPKDGEFNNPIYITRFLLYLLAGHLFLLIAPFIGYWNKNAFWNYLKSVFIAIGRSLLFSIVLYLGLCLALLAIKYLFDVKIHGKRYFEIYVFCLGIVNTWTYLSDFPQKIREQTNINYNKALEVLVKYILIPLVILYLIILYAYSIKIVLEWNLPKGWVSYLVIALSLLGFSIQVMINPIQKSIKSPIINRFHPWFYYLLLPLLVLLFVAIFKRISDYGITENRYFVLILAIWISGMTFYLLFSKNRFLKILPISLGILAILSSVGVWGAFSVSKKSQISQFEKIYSLVKSNNNIASIEEYNSLSSILNYFDDRNDISCLNTIVSIELDSVRKKSNNNINNRSYFNANYVLDSLKIERPKSENKSNSNKYRNLYLDKAFSNIDISNYSKLHFINFFGRNKRGNSIDDFTFKIIEDKTQAIVVKDGKTVYVLNLGSLIKKSADFNYQTTLPVKDLTFYFEHENASFKIIIEHLNLKIDDENQIQNLQAFVLVKYHDL